MASPYDAIVSKYAAATPPASAIQVPDTMKPAPAAQPAISANPYDAVVANIQSRQRDSSLSKNTAAADTAIESTIHPGLLKEIADTAKEVPGAVAQIGGEAVAHPVKTAQSAVLGLMDVGPSIVNFLSSVGSKATNAIYGPTATKPTNLPLPGQTFHDYVGSNDAERSISEGAKQLGSYEIGGAGVKTLLPKALSYAETATGDIGGGSLVPKEPTSFIGKAAINAAGNVAGGQITAAPDTPFGDRVKQAAFDSAFGVAHTAMTSGIGRLRTGKVPSVAEEKPVSATPETPAEEAQAPVTKVGRTLKKVSPPEAPKIDGVAYATKPNLGVDANGEKVLATTEYNAKTGKAIIYYAKSLDQNPELRQTVLDHEEGHVMDKRVNAGRNLSAELQNPTGNEATLRNTLGPFARQTGTTVHEAATNLAKEIEVLSEGHGSSHGEKFANAYAAYKADPTVAAEKAPTFAAFMSHIPVERTPVVEKTVVTGRSIGKKLEKPIESPIKLEEPTKVAKESQSQAKNSPETTKYADFPKKQILKQGATAGDKEYQGIHPENIVHFNQGANERVTLIVPKDAKEAIEIASKIRSQKLGTAKTGRSMLEGYAARNKISVDAARAKVLKISDDYKALARENAQKNNPVLLNTIEPPRTIKRAIPKETSNPTPEKPLNPERQIQSKSEKQYQIKSIGKKRTWTRAEGVAAVRQFSKHIDANGFKSEIVGSVSKLGKSSHDLDVLLTPKDGVRPSGSSILKIVDKIREKYPIAQIDNDIIGFQTPEGKTFEVFLGNVGNHIWGAEKFQNEISSRIEKDTPFFEGKSVDRKIEAPVVVRTAPPKYEAKPAPGSGRIASTGLRTGKGVNTKSFNASKINAPAEVEDLFTKLGAENKNFSSQRLSKGDQDIKDLARMTGLTEDELIKAQPGSIANAETATAARQLVLSKSQDLLNTLKSIDVSTASKADLQRIKDDFVKLVSMQKAVAGFRTEASNVFRSFGIELAAGENATLEELAALLKNEGLASEGDAEVFAGKVAKQTTLSNFEKIREGALSTWYASILSGPKTTIRNILSTGSNILTEIAAKAANPKQWKEVMPSITGLLRGLRMGLPEAREVLKGSPATSKFMDTGQNLSQTPIFTGKMANYGTIVESVGRFLNAQDKIMSAGAREMERASLKARGLDVSKEVEDAITRSYAERTVYHGKPTGKIIGSMRDAAQTLRKRFPESKLIVPFVDTVANVMDRQFDYFPITAALRLKGSIVSEQASRIMKDYELKETDRPFIEQRIRDQQVGRLALGTFISTAAIMLATGDRLSGNGPANYSKKQELTRTGWRPNSIKIGDTWVPYTYLGPLSGLLSMAGNVHDKVEYDNAPGKDLTALIGNGLVGWTQSELNQSFLSGVADLFDVATGGVTPSAYMKKFLTGLVPIPAAYSQTKDMIFRQQYETSGIVESIRQKLGLTEGMQPKLDQFGDRITSDLIFGISPSQEKAAPIDRFLVANDIVVAVPVKSAQYSVPGAHKEKRALTPAEYTSYIEDSGKQIYQELERRLPELQNMASDKQKSTVSGLVDRVRTQTRARVMRGQKS